MDLKSKISTINSSFQNSGSRKDKYLDIISITEDFKEFFCCKKNCKHYIDVYDVQKYRDLFQSKTNSDQRQFILDHLNRFYPEKPTFSINQNEICRSLWYFAYGISKSRFQRLQKDVFEEGRRDGIGNYEGKQRTAKSFSVERWIQQYAELNGDRPPDTAKIYLPSCVKQSDLFKEYKDSVGEDSVNLSSFYRIWNTYCPHITIPENTRFTKCDMCSLIKDLRVKTQDNEMKLELKDLRQRHNEQQMDERAVYYHHREKARENPEKYASIIIAGMDQNKTNLPHFRRHIKNVLDEYLKVHLNGAISHGTNETMFFLDHGEWKNDSNFTCNTLIRTLLRMEKVNDCLPPVLYLQFDNCRKENRNRNVLALCALLVAWGLVEKVRLSFLMVGHTHEDIDQIFSNISMNLKTNNAVTMGELENVIKSSFKKEPLIEKIKYVDNYAEMLGPHIYQISQHSRPHSFKFEKIQGKVHMMYRMWSVDREWEDAGEIVNTKKVGKEIKLKKPCYAGVDFSEVRKKVMNKNSIRVMDEGQLAELNQFLRDAIKRRNAWETFDIETSAGQCSLLSLNKQPEKRKRTVEQREDEGQLALIKDVNLNANTLRKIIVQKPSKKPKKSKQ